MPRPLRAFHAGLFHLSIHASDTRFLFLSDSDRVAFLVLLVTAFGRHRLTPTSYTLMGNHYHVLLHVPDARISRALQHVHTEYSRRHNRVHDRSAHLFRAHFSAREVTTDRHFRATLRYMARNPVDAGLVANPLDWPWASTRAHAGVGEPSIRLDESPIGAAFDNTPDWRERYRSLVSE